ncbi:MAG: Flp family type IVb pilin [Pseudomonadota bacterium]
MMGMARLFHRLWKDESGISSVEYALLLALIAAGIAVAASALGNAVENEINAAAGCISATGGSVSSACAG